MRTPGPVQAAIFTALLAAGILVTRYFAVDGGFSPWYPPAGIILAWLIVGTWRSAPLIVLVNVGADWLFTDGAREEEVVVLVITSAVAGYAVAATLLNRLGIGRLDLRALGWFTALGVIAAPAWSSISASVVAAWADGTPLDLTSDNVTFFVGDAIGVMTFAPMLLLLSKARRAPPVSAEVAPDTSHTEAVLGAASLVVVPFLATFADADGLFFPLVVAAVVPLVWVALRRDPTWVSVGVCASTTAVSVAARLAPGIDGDALVQIQTIMLVSVLVTAFVTIAHYGSMRRLEALLAARDELAWTATHDPTSGALNRAGLVLESLARGVRSGTVTAFVAGAGGNEVLGRAAIDQVVTECLDRLRRVLPDDAALAVLEPGVVGAILPPDPVSAKALAERGGTTLTTPIDVDGVLVHAEAGIGMAATDAVGEEAVDQAVFALRESRRRHGSAVVFDDELGAKARADAARLSDLRRALAEGQITAHYQPIMRVVDGVIVGAEALARWDDPARGLIAAGEFVPIAERAGLIGEVGAAVRAHVVDLAADLASRADLPRLTFSVNVSALEFDDDLVGDLLRLTSARGLDPSRLVIEVTETAALPDLARAASVLGALRAAGIGVSIDDFGTGHASLSQMTHLPVTEVKIDASFVQGLPGIRDEAVVRTVTALAHDLGFDLVAEGVETDEQLAILVACGVPKVQGYLVARPMAAEAFTALLADGAGPSPHGDPPSGATMVSRSVRPRPGA